MIDLIFWAQTVSQFKTFAKGKAIMVDVEQEDGTTETETIRYADLTWWAGSGKLMTKPGTYDDEGNVLTAPEFAPGFFCIVRLSGPVYEADRIGNSGKAWDKSALASGTKGNKPGLDVLPGVSAYQDGAVRIVDSDDLLAYLTANDLPGHEWAGGNVR